MPYLYAEAGNSGLHVSSLRSFDTLEEAFEHIDKIREEKKTRIEQVMQPGHYKDRALSSMDYLSEYWTDAYRVRLYDVSSYESPVLLGKKYLLPLMREWEEDGQSHYVS
jgi:hypothetical protein